MTLMAWLIVLSVPLLLAWGAARVFGHAVRQKFLAAMPLGTLVLWSFGLQLFWILLDWLAGDMDRPLLSRIAIAAALFAGTAIIWLAGFFFGRWRAARRQGILRTTR